VTARDDYPLTKYECAATVRQAPPGWIVRMRAWAADAPDAIEQTRRHLNSLGWDVIGDIEVTVA
jgi:hypothetical protein